MEDEINNNNNEVNVEDLLNKLNQSESERQATLNKNKELESQVNKLSQTREGLLSDLQKMKTRFNEQQSIAETEEEQRLLKTGDYKSIIDSKVNQKLESETSKLKEALENLTKERDEYSKKYSDLENKIKYDKVKQDLYSQALQTDVQKGAAKYLVEEALKNGKITDDGNFEWNEKYNRRGEAYGFNDFTNDFKSKNPDNDFMFQPIEGNDVKGGARKKGVKELTQAEWNKKLAETVNSNDKAKLLQEYAEGKYEIIK